jgi:hypothetical protein
MEVIFMNTERKLSAYPMHMPADLRGLLENDPRVAALPDAPPGNPYRDVLRATEMLAPIDRRFAKLSVFPGDDPFAHNKWINKPEAASRSLIMGRGKGLRQITETPVIYEDGARPEKRPDIFRYASWYVVSQAFDDIVRQFDPSAIESLPIDWRFSDQSKHDGARFLDVTRQLDAFDYMHSEVGLFVEGSLKDIDGLNFPRALKPGIAGVHLLRDSYLRSEILVSIELARALADAGMRGFTATDLQSGNKIPLNYKD